MGNEPSMCDYYKNESLKESSVPSKSFLPCQGFKDDVPYIIPYEVSIGPSGGSINVTVIAKWKACKNNLPNVMWPENIDVRSSNKQIWKDMRRRYEILLLNHVMWQEAGLNAERNICDCEKADNEICAKENNKN